MASAKATVDRDEIRKWVEERGGFPAHVKRTGRSKDPGVLRIDYPGYSGQGTLERMSWDEWFEWFDRDKLAFLYQDESDSRFSKLVSRDTVDLTGGSSGEEGSLGERAIDAIKELVQVVEDAATRGMKRVAGRKSSSKKASSSKKSSSRQASSKKASSSKKSSKKSSSKKSSGKASSKKSSSKKAAPRRSSSKKSASKNSSKKASSKRTGGKKAAKRR
jgi:hypothetical protein